MKWPMEKKHVGIGVFSLSPLLAILEADESLIDKSW